MEQTNKIQRSEVWEQIYKIVKTIPRADCNEMDAPDAPSVATTLEKLFLKLLPIHDVSRRSELLAAFSWVSSIGEQFFDSSKTVEDMVDAYLKNRQ